MHDDYGEDLDFDEVQELERELQARREAEGVPQLLARLEKLSEVLRNQD